MRLRSIVLLAPLLAAAAAPAWAGLTATPGTLSPSSNDGAIVVGAFGGTPDTADAHYSAPVADSRTVTSSGALGGATTTGALTIIDAPTPGLFATAQIDLNGVAGSQVSVQGLSHYSFQILGAPGQAPVAIDATGNVGFSPGALFAAGSTFAFLRIQEQFNGPIIVDETLNLTSASAGGFIDANDPHHLAPNPFLSFTVAETVMLFTNTVYDVTLQAQLGGSVNTSVGGLSESLFANVDPTITVSGPYAIEESPGFGGVTVNGPLAPGIPEPSTWAMLIAGFAGVGVAARRARRAAACAGAIR